MSLRQDRSLHDACAKGQIRKVRQILESNTDIASRLDQRIGFLGYTPLHEAACQGRDDILQLLLIYGGNVDAIANGNYTPLHIAASMNYVKCIKVLLKNGANIKAVDDFSHTPYQTATQHRRKESAKCLKSAEIIRAAAKDEQELKGLLHDTKRSDITETCFDEALIEACLRGNFNAACMLLVAGAQKIEESICISVRNGYYKISTLLLVCFATLKGDVTVLEMLLDKPSLERYEWLQEFVDESVPIGLVVESIRECLKTVEDYTRVAITLPGLKTENAAIVLGKLLSNTSCRVKEKKVDWSKLYLKALEESWLSRIMPWVQFLNLSHNKLSWLPERLVDLKMLVSLNLSKNELKAAPSAIFSMISLRDVNLSENSIAELPDIPQWRPVLKTLNVSRNQLTWLPSSIAKSCIETLNLSHNKFSRVPPCVCDIISLKDLDLSGNREINFLPDEMGKLRNLTHINLKNLDQITDPPEQVRMRAEELVMTLRRRLRNCEPYYTMKLMLVGKGGQGKTTLVHRLREDFSFKEDDLTQGVEISDLYIRRGTFHVPYTFKVWDFAGQEDYYVTHQCFLSSMALYLLVWRLIDGKEGVEGLIPWLDNIAARSPGSTVIVVGTHLDCIKPEEHGADYVTEMKYSIRELVANPRYKAKVIVPKDCICAVSCAFGGSRAEVSSLRTLIYDTATNLRKGRLPVMGELIPSSFVSLIQRIEGRKAEMLEKKQLPIINKEEFDAIVKENSLHCRRDIQERMDVHDATVFLRERGVIMHFDDPNEGLSDLYFIEPRWLCALMARVITIRGHADLVKDGILEIQDTKYLFKSDLPFHFLEQYTRLLVRFQIVYLLDESRVLVPSKLPESEPEAVTKMQLPYAPVRRIYKIDYHRLHGFWSRFMSRFFFYAKEMIAVDATRYEKAHDSEHSYFGYFCRSCLHISDASETRTFSCFMKGEWETGKSEETKRTSEDFTDSSASTTNGISRDTAKNGPSGEGASSKDPTSKDPTSKDPTKKHPLKKDQKSSWRNRLSKKSRKESKRKDPVAKISTGGEASPLNSSPSEDNAFSNSTPPCEPAMRRGGSAGRDDMQSLLLDPSVKIFSDDELHDDTDGDHIMINHVDTAMDYGRRVDSLYDKQTESVKRMYTDMRIPSYDEDSVPGWLRRSPRRSQNTTTPNGDVRNSENTRSDSSGNERRLRNISGRSKADQRNASGQSTNEDSASTCEDNPAVAEDRAKTSEGFPGSTEDAAYSTEDIPTEKREIATEGEQNPTGNNSQPKNNAESSPSNKACSGETLAADQIDIIIHDDLIDNIEDRSEAKDSDYSREETTDAIKIPNFSLGESDENTSYLSRSDICSLSSWTESKHLPSLRTVSGFPENDSFSGTVAKNVADDNAQIGTTSMSSNDSSTSRNDQEFGISSLPLNASQEQRVAGDTDLRNSVSQSVSTTSSVRSDDPTDTDCEVFSESLSSISTTNSKERFKIADNRPENHPDIQAGRGGGLDTRMASEPDVVEVDEDQLARFNSFPNSNDKNSVKDNCVPFKESAQNDQIFVDETDAHNSEELKKRDDGRNEANASGNDDDKNDMFAPKDMQVSPREVNGSSACNDSTGNTIQQSESVDEQSEIVGKQSEGVGEQSDGVDEKSQSVGLPSDGLGKQSESGGAQLEGVVNQSESDGVHAENVDSQSEHAGEQSERGGGPPEDDRSATKSETVETRKCTLCKEIVAVDQLVTLALDIGELIELKYLHCWRSGVCFVHPEAFLVVVYRALSDSVVVEIGVSPNALGRRLMTFVVDHLDTLIKEWYPGIGTSDSSVKKLIPCRTCEKDGNPRPHMFTFDSCVTQYSMGNFVKCPEHEVSMHDIAPDVVLHDIDADLVLQENDMQYDRSDANIIGKGACGKVYRGRCRDRDAAIKEYSSVISDQEDAMKRYSEVRKEVNILRRFGQHAYLVNFIGVCLRPFRLVLELATEGSLAKTLFQPKFLIERVVMYRMLFQVADALSFLHSLKIIYRDLKPQNVLVMSYDEKQDTNIKLTDFGTAAFQFNEGLISLEGTPGYHAPEMLKQFCKRTGYDEKVDVFALGSVMYGFITRRHPFFTANSTAEVNNIVAEGGRPEYDDVIRARMGFAGLTWVMNSCHAFEPNSRHNSKTIAEQLQSTSFQLFMGLIAVPSKLSVRQVCLVQATMELWVAVDDRAGSVVFIYDLKNWCLKKKFTINRLDGLVPLCLHVRCMHVTKTEVLIGLRGDRNVVAMYDTESYNLKAKISLDEPVFSLSSNEMYIFLGMANGMCLIMSRAKQLLTMEISQSEPVTCVTALGNEFLWCAAGKYLQIFQNEAPEKIPVYELNAVRFSASSAPFSETAHHGTNIWCTSKGDSIVTAWDTATRQKTLEIDCESFLSPGYNLLDAAVTCVLPVLDTVWIGTGGGKLFIADVTSGELITSLKLFDDYVRSLTLVPGPGPCGTEKCYVVVSGKNVQETALSRENRGKHVCRLNSEVIKPAPSAQITPAKTPEKTNRKSIRSPFGGGSQKTSSSPTSSVDGPPLDYTQGCLLMFFEALPAGVLRRAESK